MIEYIVVYILGWADSPGPVQLLHIFAESLFVGENAVVVSGEIQTLKGLHLHKLFLALLGENFEQLEPN